MAVFAFTQSSYDIRESDGQLDVTVELINGTLTFDVVVIVTSFPATATGIEHHINHAQCINFSIDFSSHYFEESFT